MFICNLDLERRPYLLHHRISGLQLCPSNVNGTARLVHHCPLRGYSSHVLYQPAIVSALSCLVVCL